MRALDFLESFADMTGSPQNLGCSLDPGVGICHALTHSLTVSVIKKKRDKKKKKDISSGPGALWDTITKASAKKST